MSIFYRRNSHRLLVQFPLLTETGKVIPFFAYTEGLTIRQCLGQLPKKNNINI